MRVPPALPEAHLEESTLLAEDRQDSTGLETLLYTKEPTTESQSKGMPCRKPVSKCVCVEHLGEGGSLASLILQRKC